jgi:16S rRNA (uracil1498-N3)-methyltransferase
MDLFLGNQIDSEVFHLNEEESHHCVRVLRHRLYDEILVTEFQGKIWQATIVDLSSTLVKCRITKVFREERLTNLSIVAFGMLQDRERMEWMVEKMTEFGVDIVIPLKSERSMKSNLNLVRLGKIITAACKQNLRTKKPIIAEIQTIQQLIASHSNAQKFVAHCQEEIKTSLWEVVQSGKDALICIGPEGDFSSKEIELMLHNGFHAVSLGQSRLRSETAAIAACHIFAMKSELEYED